jgi:arginyl-tRNA synthetase
MTTTVFLVDAISAALSTAGIDASRDEILLERPQREEHGDLSTNIALVVAKRASEPPRQVAEDLAARLRAAGVEHVESVEVAGPGFVNFRLRSSYYHDALASIVTEGEAHYARPNLGHDERVQIEFVSANPTGPLHVGNGWFGAYGDALGRLLERCGFAVEREYYLNDTGNQIKLLGESLLARRAGDAPPEEGYQGEYLVELATDYEGPDEAMTAGKYASDRIVANITATLERLGIVFDRWYSQASIEESGLVDQTIAILRNGGAVYDADGATWFRSSAFGDSRDRVLVRSDGQPTYLAGDLAYHRDKFVTREFDRVIDVWGADHHGQVASLRAGVSALGIDPERLEILLGQVVSLVSGKMSKRAGHFVRLDELIDTVGPDATRLLTLMNSINQSTTIDLDAVQRQSMENPVYYVQYAYARIESIGRVAKDRGVKTPSVEKAQLSLLVHPREIELIRRLIDLPSVVEESAVERAPYKVTNWVRQLASDFHAFYHDCRVLGDEISDELSGARLVLVEAVKAGLLIGLGILGVSAPESM